MRLVRMGRLSAELELGNLTVIATSDGETAMPLAHLCGPDGGPLPDLELAGADIIDGKLRLPVHAFAVRGDEGGV